MIPAVGARNVQKDIGNDRSYVESNNNTAISLEREVNDWSFTDQRLLKDGSTQRIYKINDNHYVKYVRKPNNCKFVKIGDLSNEESAKMKQAEKDIIANFLIAKEKLLHSK